MNLIKPLNMKLYSKKLLSIALSLTLLIAFSACDEEDDDNPAPATTQNNNTGGSGSGGTGGTGGTGGSGGTDTSSVAANTLSFPNADITLNEYTVTSPVNSGSTNNDIRLDVFVDALDLSKGYWIVGLHELPTASGSMTSNFSYHWQNMPQGKFYFSKAKDASGGEWWYTDSQDITLDIDVSGDILTLTCKDITVGDDFLPHRVNNTTTVTVSAKFKISDIQSATSSGTVFNLAN